MIKRCHPSLFTRIMQFPRDQSVFTQIIQAREPCCGGTTESIQPESIQYILSKMILKGPFGKESEEFSSGANPFLNIIPSINEKYLRIASRVVISARQESTE